MRLADDLDVRERITVIDQKVCALAGRDGADLILHHEDLRIADRCGTNDV